MNSGHFYRGQTGHFYWGSTASVARSGLGSGTGGIPPSSKARFVSPFIGGLAILLVPVPVAGCPFHPTDR